MKNLISMSVQKAQLILSRNAEAKDVQIEINGGAVCVGGFENSINHLRKYGRQIGSDKIEVYFDGIEAYLKTEEEEKVARESRINQNKLNLVVRDLNELCKVYRDELGVLVLSSVIDHEKNPYILNVQFNGAIENAEFAAEWIAETAHVKAAQYKELYNLLLIDTYNFNEDEL